MEPSRKWERMAEQKFRPIKTKQSVTLKTVAARIGLTPGTVSAVLNESPAARTIPARTKDRIWAAARELNYRPNFFARTLRSKKTNTIGVIAQELGDAYGSVVISGSERYLRSHNYFFMTVAHHHDPDMIEKYIRMLVERGVEGFLAVDTFLDQAPPVPTVAIAGHRKLDGVTNVVLDHDHAAKIALLHLVELGHSKICVLRGQPFSADSKDRWTAIQAASRRLGLEVPPERVVAMDRDDPSPRMGYEFTKRLMAQCQDFSAIFAYNDIAAIGAIHALREGGLRVPEDVSVLGFDDIREAAFQSPPLTTVVQPMQIMGEIAAQTLIDRIDNGLRAIPEIKIQPELVIRQSTARYCPRP